MKNRRKHAPAQKKKDRPISTPVRLLARLPDQLRQAAQRCADSTGVSLNGLVCTALADYLTSRGYRVHGK